ncbi:TRAP transporter large permease [Chloroflexota bacterium]
MDPLLIGILGIVFLLFFLACGVHIALALGVVGLIGSILIKGFMQGVALASLVAFYKVAEPVLLVLALFVFMGTLGGAVGISRDLYSTLSLWVGRLRGALGIATVFSCAGFGVVTGSSVATASIFARVSAPEMRRQGYDKRLAYGICASAGPIGMFIPPSNLIVFYSVMANLSTARLLMAGIVPGVIMTVIFIVGIMALGYIKPALVGGSAPPVTATWRKRLTSLRLLWPIIICGLIIIGGIFGGVFSPNEAAAWGAMVIMLITVLTTGHRRWNIITKGVLDAVSMTAMMFFIMIGAAVFARFLMLSGITPLALGYVTTLGLSNAGFVIIMTAIYLVMGCFLDAISMLSITLPMIVPVVKAMGIDPIYFAMVAILAIEVGLITPPVGLNVYVAQAVAEPDVSVEDVFRGSALFFILDLVLLSILIAFPTLTTILPSLML